VVVAVGLTVIEPPADAEVNVPGVMAILVAPVAAHVIVLLVPEAMLVGSAVKEEIVGTAPVPEGELEEVFEPQPTSPAHASRIRAGARRSGPKKFIPRDGG
jgi:hypothetical protein